MTRFPRINVSISHYNTSSLLRATLASIRAQTYTDFSIVICDAVSSDGFAEVISEYQEIIDRCISEPDAGFYDGLSKAFAIDRGNGVYCYINAGDVYMPYAFEAVAEVFARGDVHWLTGIPAFRDSRMRLRSTLNPLPYISTFIANGMHDGIALPCIQQESTFWSYTLHQQISLDRLRTFAYAGDGFMWRNFSETAQLWVYNRVLSSFTAHGGHLSSRRDAYRSELREVTLPYLMLFIPAVLYSILGRILRIPRPLYRLLPFLID